MTAVEHAAAAVWAELGAGRCETAYSHALAIELSGYHQYPVPVVYKDVTVSVGRADVFLPCHDGRVVVEVKVSDHITPDARNQANAYARSLRAISVVVAFPKTATKKPLIEHVAIDLVA